MQPTVKWVNSCLLACMHGRETGGTEDGVSHDSLSTRTLAYTLLSRAGATIEAVGHEDGPQVHVRSVLSLPSRSRQQHLNQVSA